MDDLNISRYRQAIIETYGFTPNCGEIQSHTISEPLFNFDLGYTPESSPSKSAFDSNYYFNSFGFQDTTMLGYQMMPMFPTECPSFMPEISLASFLLPNITLKKPTVNNPAQKTYSLNTSIKFPSLSAAGYNSSLAKALAQDALTHRQSRSTGHCARYVSNALDRLGISGKRGHAYELQDSLRKNSHFKEISISSVDVKKLPAGCILVYPQGAAGYSKKYGHVEITVGNGTAVSDFLNHNIKTSPNMSIFVPVSA